MKNRSRIEVILIVAAFILIALLLTFFGRSHIIILENPVSQRIDRPSDAYDLWRAKAIHGRILYLFDRNLNAKPGYYLAAEFSEDEFVDGYSVSALCEAIRSSRFATGIPDALCDINALNGLLKMQMGPNVLTEDLREQLPPEALTLLKITQGYGKGYANLGPRPRDRFERLNRLIIETAFPELCPRSAKFEISDENFVFAAIKKGYIRRIYHIIPDSAWPDVERNLMAFPAAHFSRGMYRLPIEEGVPVDIMRLGDIRPEREPVLMTVNGNSWNDEEVTHIAELLRRSVLHSDLLTYFGPISPEGIRGLSAHVH